MSDSTKKRKKAYPTTVSMLDLILERAKLNSKIFDLECKIEELRKEREKIE